MTVSAPAGVARTIDLSNGVTLTFTEYGDRGTGRGPVLTLHGGGGLRTVAGFAAALSERAHVIAPIHPGFDATPRPQWADSIADLASIQLDLLDALDLANVLVVGSSIGGWIAAEMAVRDNHHRIGGLVLVNAVGIRTDRPDDITDIRGLSPAELGALSFHNPALISDPATLDDGQRAMLAANQQTLEVYAGDPYMHDPKLRGRLHRVDAPTLVLWGEDDGVVSVDYGRAYADSFPRHRFEIVPEAGHLPHIEQPARVMQAVSAFVDTELKR